ncbi:MAG: proline--tRNA ligase, partial [bacterium]
AYIRVFKRCGLEFLTIEADPGAIGGTGSQEFMIKSESGEDQIITCASCDYAANIETAISKLATPKQDKTLKVLHIEHTPQVKTVEQLVELFNLPSSQMVKTILYEVWFKGSDKPEILAILMRGDLDINEVKLGKVAAKIFCRPLADLAIARPEVVIEKTKAEIGFAGPIGLESIKIIADESVRLLKNFLCGANKTDYHVLDVNIGRDFPEPEYSDLRNAVAGDSCPRCKDGKVRITKGIELGHIFKLGTKYSRVPTKDNPTGLSATYLDKDGKEYETVMGCYGIGITRITTSAIELYHDDFGMIWPINIAPWHVVIIVANITDSQQIETSTKLYEELNKIGVETVLDDREARIGFKLNDADLVGYPYKLIVGKGLKNGEVELKSRKTGDVIRLKLEDAVEKIRELVQRELAKANQVD